MDPILVNVDRLETAKCAIRAAQDPYRTMVGLKYGWYVCWEEVNTIGTVSIRFWIDGISSVGHHPALKESPGRLGPD